MGASDSVVIGEHSLKLRDELLDRRIARELGAADNQRRLGRQRDLTDRIYATMRFDYLPGIGRAAPSAFRRHQTALRIKTAEPNL